METIVDSSRPLVYLASPYTHSDSAIRAERAKQAAEATAYLISTYGWNVFSPIVHSHPLHEHGGLNGKWEFWEVIDRQYLALSNRVVIFDIDGAAKQSTGVQAEISIAREMNLPIDLLTRVRGQWMYQFDKPDGGICNRKAFDTKEAKEAVCEGLKGIENALRGPGGAPTRASTFPLDSAGRKRCPVASGVLDYFPDALIAIAEVSYTGNEQHSPGQPLHWARSKSTDESDCIIRHFLQRGMRDTDGMRHSAKMAWRALALLQKEIENETQH